MEPASCNKEGGAEHPQSDHVAYPKPGKDGVRGVGQSGCVGKLGQSGGVDVALVRF